MESAPAYEFRTTCAAPFVNETAVETIAKTIEGAACYVLQPFNRRAVCLDPAFNQRQDPSLLPEEMQRLKNLASLCQALHDPVITPGFIFPFR